MRLSSQGEATQVLCGASAPHSANDAQRVARHVSSQLRALRKAIMTLCPSSLRLSRNRTRLRSP